MAKLQSFGDVRISKIANGYLVWCPIEGYHYYSTLKMALASVEEK